MKLDSVQNAQRCKAVCELSIVSYVTHTYIVGLSLFNTS
jgi:hypothetical protein